MNIDDQRASDPQPTSGPIQHTFWKNFKWP